MARHGVTPAFGVLAGVTAAAAAGMTNKFHGGAQVSGA